MEANELRIGNIVSRENTGHFFEITAKHLLNWHVFKAVLFPMCLNDDILEKCGNIAPIELMYDDSDAPGIAGDYRFKYNDGMIIIEYLHQIQNLYFVLTGKELEIKW